MPAGELYSREIRSSEPPEDLHRRVVVQLSPLLAPANYKLAAQDPQHVEYCRRYLPTAAVIVALLAFALAGGAVLADAPVAAAGLGAIALSTLLVARRSEALRVAVQPRPGGSTAFLSGYLSGRARMSVIAFEPPCGQRGVVAGAHVAVGRQTAGPTLSQLTGDAYPSSRTTHLTSSSQQPATRTSIASALTRTWVTRAWRPCSRQRMRSRSGAQLLYRGAADPLLGRTQELLAAHLLAGEPVLDADAHSKTPHHALRRTYVRILSSE